MSFFGILRFPLVVEVAQDGGVRINSVGVPAAELSEHRPSDAASAAMLRDQLFGTLAGNSKWSIVDGSDISSSQSRPSSQREPMEEAPVKCDGFGMDFSTGISS